MKEEKKIEFTQKWIGDAVKKLLQKDDIYESDMERIKYLRIGVDFNSGFLIEMSTKEPPEPFYDTDNADDWLPGGEGGSTATGRFIPLFIDYMKKNPFDILVDAATGEHYLQLLQFHFWNEFEEEYNEEDSKEWEEEGERWEDIEKEWKSYEKTMLCEIYKESFGDKEAYEEWYRQVKCAIRQDIGLFTGTEVLRLQGAIYQDLTFLRAMPLLRALEVTETDFVSYEGIDDLVRLKQICC